MVDHGEKKLHARRWEFGAYRIGHGIALSSKRARGPRAMRDPHGARLVSSEDRSARLKIVRSSGIVRAPLVYAPAHPARITCLTPQWPRCNTSSKEGIVSPAP